MNLQGQPVWFLFSLVDWTESTHDCITGYSSCLVGQRRLRFILLRLNWITKTTQGLIETVF